MNRKLYILFIIAIQFFLSPMGASAQKTARDLLRIGNAAYREKMYDQAETMYLMSLAIEPSYEAFYNLGNTYVMQQKDSTAYQYYLKAEEFGTKDPLRRAKLFHNVGNIFYSQGLMAMKQNGQATQMFQSAVQSYSASLRCNPDDNETRYNLAMAQYMLKKNKDKNGDGGGGGNDDKNQDQQNKDKQKQDQKKDEQKQNEQNQDKQDKNKQDQQQQQNKDDMSDQTAEQLLQSAQQDEKGVQRKVKQMQNGKRKTLEKDW